LGGLILKQVISRVLLSSFAALALTACDGDQSGSSAAAPKSQSTFTSVAKDATLAPPTTAVDAPAQEPGTGDGTSQIASVTDPVVAPVVTPAAPSCTLMSAKRRALVDQIQKNKGA